MIDLEEHRRPDNGLVMNRQAGLAYSTLLFCAVPVFCAMLLVGCGFQLKDHVDIPNAYSPIRLSGSDGMVIEAISDILSQHRVLTTTDDSAAEIRIERDEFQKAVETVNSLGIATGYAYRYTVEYRITDRRGVVKVPNEVISQSTSLRYEAGNELEIENEEHFYKRQMALELAGRIIRRLRWL